MRDGMGVGIDVTAACRPWPGSAWLGAISGSKRLHLGAWLLRACPTVDAAHRHRPLHSLKAPAMSIVRSKAFVLYLCGILCVALGAQVSSITQSMLPLALAGAAAVMLTAALVRDILGSRRSNKS